MDSQQHDTMLCFKSDHIELTSGDLVFQWLLQVCFEINISWNNAVTFHTLFVITAKSTQLHYCYLWWGQGSIAKIFQ